MLELSLERLQNWMQAVIVQPGTTEEALHEQRAVVPPASVEQVILPSSTLTPAERLGIYQGMYPLRMNEALQGDYAALQHFLGDERFEQLVLAYVQVHPSRTYTLNRLGDHLPEFVLAAPGLARRGFLHDLARLELAISDVFDSPETPSLTSEAIAAVAPGDWERARLATIDAFRLLAFRYNANDYLQSVRDDDHKHPRPKLKSSWLVVYRREYDVYRLELSRPAHDLLADLSAGTRLGDALAAAMKRGRPAPGEEQLSRWFRQWMAAGLFRSVQID
jgi:hypothetical protein